MDVMVIDDEQFNVDMALRVLRPLYEVKGFTDPVEAVAELEEDPSQFRVVVTDYKMPGMDGTEVVKRVRKLDRAVVLVSAYTETRAVIHAYEAGYVDIMLAKPWSPPTLKDAVKRALAIADERGS